MANSEYENMSVASLDIKGEGIRLLHVNENILDSISVNKALKSDTLDL